MGQYNGAVITTAGQVVLAQAIGGAELTITKVVTSATSIPPGTDLTALTAIDDVEQTERPTSVQVFNDNIVQISTRFSNAAVAAAYLIQTLGVFGQVTGGAETLLAVSTAVTPDQMPAEDAIAPSAFIYNIQLTVQSADQITVTVNDAGTATVADVQALDAAKLGKSGDGKDVTVTFDETADHDVTSFATFLSSIVSGLSLSKFLRVIKTGLSYIAPKNHAADDVIYGGGDATNYGHVRLSDIYNSQIGTAAQSIGASQKAVADMYTTLNSKLNTTYAEKISVNTLVENGTYFCYQCTNLPVFDEINSWILTVNKYSSTYVKQTAQTANQYSRNLIMLERTRVHNAWSNWNIIKNFVADESVNISGDYSYYVKFGNAQYGSAVVAGTFGGIGSVLIGITINSGSITSIQNLMTGNMWSDTGLSFYYTINANDSRGYLGIKTTSTSKSTFSVTSF